MSLVLFMWDPTLDFVCSADVSVTECSAGLQCCLPGPASHLMLSVILASSSPRLSINEETQKELYGAKRLLKVLGFFQNRYSVCSSLRMAKPFVFIICMWTVQSLGGLV